MVGSAPLCLGAFPTLNPHRTEPSTSLYTGNQPLCDDLCAGRGGKSQSRFPHPGHLTRSVTLTARNVVCCVNACNRGLSTTIFHEKPASNRPPTPFFHCSHNTPTIHSQPISPAPSTPPPIPKCQRSAPSLLSGRIKSLGASSFQPPTPKFRHEHSQCQPRTSVAGKETLRAARCEFEALALATGQGSKTRPSPALFPDFSLQSLAQKLGDS